MILYLCECVGEKYGWVEGNRAHLESNAWQEGGEAYTKAMIEWLFELCIEHPSKIDFDILRKPYRMYENLHHQCPQCMWELKEWSGKL